MTRYSHDRAPSQGEVAARPESDREFLNGGTLLGRGELAVLWTRCPGARASRGQDVSCDGAGGLAAGNLDATNTLPVSTACRPCTALWLNTDAPLVMRCGQCQYLPFVGDRR